ncbi:MAG: pilus assembly protein PilM [Actinomycetia bacterium]|nr:pilus assembly protein PilM [Actinomycetes bacterium]MCP4844904.1 pilus assembly protein PilM [Actinomycetes bacterium]
MRSNRTAAIEIGTRSVRAVEVAGVDRSGFAIVSKIAVAPLPNGAVNAGKIRNPVLVGHALTQAVQEAGIKPYGPIVGFGGTCALTEVEIPAGVKPEEREQAIRAMRIEISPVLPLEDSVLSINEANRFVRTDGNTRSRLSVAAVSTEELANLVNVCRLAGVEPRAIDLLPAATMRAYVRVPEDTDDVFTVVDVGDSRTLVITRGGRDIRSTKQVNMGGRAFTDAILANFDGTEADAEERKRHLYLGDRFASTNASLRTGYGSTSAAAQEGHSDRLREAVDRVTTELVDQVANAVSTDAVSFNNHMTRGILLAGGAGQMPGLADRITEATGVPVQVARPWAQLQKTKSNLAYLDSKGAAADPSLLTEIGPAVGLALWKERS